MTAWQRFCYFPSLHAPENVVLRAGKFVFEIITKLTVSWWAMLLIGLCRAIRFRWGVLAVKQIPNAMSIFRILVSPYLGWLLLSAAASGNTAESWHWLQIFAFVAALDGLDGPAARDLEAVSDFGKVIDPAADKVLFGILLIDYCALVGVLNGFIAFVPLMSFAVWCTLIEIRLVAMPFKFKPLLDKLGVDHPGANKYGKIKFNLQMFGLFVGWGLIVAQPTNLASACWSIPILVLARSFADRSLGRHREELAWLIVLDNIHHYGRDWHLITRGDDEEPEPGSTSSTIVDTDLYSNVIPIRKLS